jgi:hypothetical protein
MSALAICFVAFLLAIVLPEPFLRRSTMLAQLPKVVAVHAGCAAPTTAYLVACSAGSAGALWVAWAGAFLIWLTVRSHISSSILLRMVHMLGERPLSASELTARYELDHGSEHRARQLESAGLTRGRARTLAGRTLAFLGRRLQPPAD